MYRTPLLFIISLFLVASLLHAQGRGIGMAPKEIPNAFTEGAYRALIFGNNDYRDPKRLWTPLKTALNDAESVSKVLKEDYGFQDVRLIKNATRRDIIREFNDLAKRSKKVDSVVVFYAGHSYLRESTKEGFWIPVDAEGRDDSTFVANAVINTKMEVVAENVRHLLLVSDSCFSGALLRAGNRGINLDEKTNSITAKWPNVRASRFSPRGGWNLWTTNTKVRAIPLLPTIFLRN